jgi:CRISPR-associated protein Cmr2
VSEMSQPDEVELEWSLGPVQSFVTAARRTRDLWGGSYLLSLLVAEAAAAAGDHARFRLPPHELLGEDPLVRACRRWRAGGGADGRADPIRADLPGYASLPNHLRLRLPARELHATAGQMTTAVQDLWRELADAVWKRFIEQAAAQAEDPGQIRRIWDRQVGSWWEVTWVASDGTGGALARRKQWRTHLLPEEPGDRCMVHPGLQELSGQLASTGPTARAHQERFWDKVREHTGEYDLRRGERLSAPALVKRLWPKVARDLRPELPDGTSWPSTLHLALASWVEKVVSEYPEEAGELLREITEQAGRPVPDLTVPPLPGLTPHRLWGVSPEVLFNTLTGEPSPPSEQARRLLACAGPPSRFWALLLADGDRLGKAAADLGGDTVGQALADFSERTGSLARQAHAVVVYAGGDDVLAMAPVHEALCLADALARAYGKAFASALRRGGVAQTAPTLSAAVVFAHARAPLAGVLRAGRYLLDNVAKEGNGRASLAVSLRHRGGETARWVRAFARGDGGRPVAQLARFTEDCRRLTGDCREEDGRRPGMLTTALYRASTVVRGLLAPQPSCPGERGTCLITDPVLLRGLVATELARASREGEKLPAGKASELAGNLVELMTWVPGCQPGGKVHSGRETDPGREMDLDAVPLVRFLLTGGRDER